MTTSKRLLVTAALPYANGPLHLGHLAGAYLPADFYVRFMRLNQQEVLFICGSDEHGVPITIAADKEGVRPQDIVDRYHPMLQKTFENMAIGFDHYGRTSSPVHHQTSQSFFTTLNDKGLFKKKTERQLYDPTSQMFLPDRYVKGTCPVCSHPEAYGDQCEKCGTSLSPSELIDPRSSLSGSVAEWRETEHWFLPLGDFQPWIASWLESRRDWKPNVMGQCKSWLQAGLGDRAVTRDLTWGVPVPLDEAKGKVLYVWFDAPIGYISATKEWAALQGDPERWKTYWCDQETELVHFIGKDNIVFHCIMFPAMLHAHGDFVLPVNVPANEFLNLEGRKLSTSRGWAVWVDEFLSHFEADLIRYGLGAIMPENKDADFSWKEFQQRINSDLADILGNFIYRTTSFTARFFEGKVPEITKLDEASLQVLAEIEVQKKRIEEAYRSFSFKEALAESLQLARIGNKYFTDREPWKTKKTNSEHCAITLYTSLQLCAALSAIFDPIMPQKMAQLRAQLGVQIRSWEDIGTSLLPSEHPIAEGEILFAKIEDEKIQARIDALYAKSQLVEASSSATTSTTTDPEKPSYAEPKPEIVIDDFAKMDLRIGKVLEAEAVKGSKKLLKLKVDLGYEQRTILSGIAMVMTPEQILGKQVVVVANLKPRPMMGTESHGMILMSEDRNGQLVLVQSDNEPGSTVS
jgi:methionyl-tRNA synthetase